MKNTILVAGATGDLGSRICKQLLKQGAGVRVLVRKERDEAKVNELREFGAVVVTTDYNDEAALIFQHAKGSPALFPCSQVCMTLLCLRKASC